MQSFDDLIVPIHDVLCRAMNLPSARVILANQDRAGPISESYATYLPTPLRAYGWPSRKSKEIPAVEDFDPAIGAEWTDLEHTLSTNWIVHVSVTAFNKNAATNIAKLANSHLRDDILYLCHKHEISFRNISNVRNLSAVMQGSTQPRYNVDIEMWARLDVSINILRAARVPFTIRDKDSSNILIEG